MKNRKESSGKTHRSGTALHRANNARTGGSAGSVGSARTGGAGFRRSQEAAPSTGFRNLQRGLTGERGLVGKSYMDDPEMLAAYLGYYWPASRAQCLAVLDRIGFIDGFRDTGSPILPVRTLIDAGSGPGPVSAAFATRGTIRFSLLDQSPAALELARKKILQSGDSAPSIFTLSGDIRAPDPERIAFWGEADCVAFGHSLNELWADKPDRVQLRTGLLETWSQALAPGGFILAVEPALLETSRDLIAVRNLLVERGWQVLAPCPGRETLNCPALEAGDSHTCHETARWDMPEETARLAQSLSLDRERLKMTWFALRPPQRTAEPAHLPAKGKPAAVPEPAAAPECNALTVSDTMNLYRVVSDPMLNKAGRVRKLLCGAAGRFPLSAAVKTGGGSKETGKGSLPGKTDYPVFDRLERGDYVQVIEPEIRENGWGMGPDTELSCLFPVIK